MTSEELARRCRKERKERDLNQKEVADSLGVTIQAVSKAENYTQRDGMDRFRVKVLEELTGGEVKGPLWTLKDAPEVAKT